MRTRNVFGAERASRPSRDGVVTQCDYLLSERNGPKGWGRAGYNRLLYSAARLDQLQLERLGTRLFFVQTTRSFTMASNNGLPSTLS